jgi:membrane protein YqaA with SNARE-associated domain
MHDFVLWMQEKLIPFLGPPGMFLVALLDSSALSLPEVNDIFLVTESSARPHSAWMYILATTLGSVTGCSLLWLVGKRGGEPLLVRRFGAVRVEQTRRAFRRWDLLALAVPALMPPPMPFKMFVFSAGVFGVPYRRFVFAIAAARGARYTMWGILGAFYGDDALRLLKTFDRWFDAHAPVIIAVFVIFLLLAALVVLRRRPPAEPS